MSVLLLPFRLLMAFLRSEHAFWRVMTVAFAILGSVYANQLLKTWDLEAQLARQDTRKVEMVAEAKAVVIEKGDDLEASVLAEFCGFDAGLCDVVKKHTSYKG